MSRARFVHSIFTLTALFLFAGCGGETVISGIGNGGNVFASDLLESVAHELAGLEPALPPVSDDDLRAAWSAIRDKARAGDPDATFVLLRVAAEQRKANEEK